MMIIAIVGMPGSGKSVLSAYFKTLGYPVIRFGEIVVREVERRGLPLNPLNERIVREDIREKFGMDACARLALPVIKDLLQDNEVVIIDGLYSFSEYKTLRKEFQDDLVLIAVAASRQLRYHRLSLRQERPLTRDEAEERDVREIEQIEKGGPIALADFTLLNDGTPEQLTAKAAEVLSSLGAHVPLRKQPD